MFSFPYFLNFNPAASIDQHSWFKLGRAGEVPFSLMINSLFTWINRNKYFNFKKTTNSTYLLRVIRELLVLLAKCCCLFFGIEQALGCS